MTSRYARMTLNDLVEALEALPENAGVSGLGDELDSYRGYYERTAIEPYGATY